MAATCNYIMDPSGDVVLTLNNANAPFAVWDHPDMPPEEAKAAPETLTFLLSSRHLTLASPVLKAMLSGGWTEGAKDEDGLLRLNAEDWDGEALSIIMNAVHDQWSLVPTKVSLEMLAKIATIMDYYGIREALHLVSSLWMENIKVTPVPNSLCRETLLWILIASVF